MRRMARLWVGVVAGGSALAPAAALAHAFGVYDSVYNNFLEGAAVFLSAPGLLLPVLALAVALALWRREGLLEVWGAVAVATVLGIAISPFSPPWVAMLPMGLGLVMALLTALVRLERISAAMLPLAVLTAGAVMLAVLEGHAWSEVPTATKVGLLFGFHLILSVSAGLVRLVSARIDHPAATIGVRILASWIAAILVLYLAFVLNYSA